MINNSLNITTKTIEEKIVTNTPFSHFYINKVFPEELFKLIHDNWPTVDLFENGLKAGHNLEAERFYFKLIEGNIKNLSGEKRFFWEKIEKWLRCDELVLSLLNKYKNDIDILQNKNVEDYYLNNLKTKVTFNTSLVMDMGGYELRPHPDDPRVILNLLFYLPYDDEGKQLGTSIYTSKEKDLVKKYQNVARFPRSWFNLVKTFPYQPNSLFSFARSDYSFHGVEPSKNSAYTRRLMLLSLMFKNES